MSNRRGRRRPQRKDNYKPPYSQQILAESVTVLTLREQTLLLLQKANINTLLDVLRREEKDFYRISTFNKKNLMDLKKALQSRNLSLKPTQEKKETTQDAVQKSGQNDNPNQNRNKGRQRRQPNKDRNNANRNRNKDRYGTVDSPTFSTILPPKPPKVIFEIEKEKPDIYVKVNRGGKWGFKDRAGKQIVAPIYDEVFSYKEDICCVEKDELFGFINREGEIIVPIEYTCATSFSEGYACVFKKDKCGYIDVSNQVIIDFKYDAGTAVLGGECRVKLDGKWGELHINNPYEVRWIN